MKNLLPLLALLLIINISCKKDEPNTEDPADNFFFKATVDGTAYTADNFQIGFINNRLLINGISGDQHMSITLSPDIEVGEHNIPDFVDVLAASYTKDINNSTTVYLSNVRNNESTINITKHDLIAKTIDATFEMLLSKNPSGGGKTVKIENGSFFIGY